MCVCVRARVCESVCQCAVYSEISLCAEFRSSKIAVSNVMGDVRYEAECQLGDINKGRMSEVVHPIALPGAKKILYGAKPLAAITAS